MKNLAVSPCSNPRLTLEQALRAYAPMGFTKFEAFAGGWPTSGLDPSGDAASYRDLAQRFGMRFSSLHLPRIATAAELPQAIAAARFAQALGAGVVLFKAASRELYIETCRAFLDAVAPLALTTVIQNHHGSPVTSLEDYRVILEGVADPRLKTVLEVGHFHKAGVLWRDGYALLGSTVALVHIKDMKGTEPVPFGEGEVDLPGLFRELKQKSYAGDIVVEMEVTHDDEQTLRYLAQAVAYLQRECLK